MTDPSAPSSHHPPRRRPAAIEDLTLLVRVPDRPELIRAFTAAEEAEADAYAAANGGTIEQLPKSTVLPRSAQDVAERTRIVSRQRKFDLVAVSRGAVAGTHR